VVWCYHLSTARATSMCGPHGQVTDRLSIGVVDIERQVGVYNTTPSIPSCFMAFFSDFYCSFEFFFYSFSN